jgi:hypothetical protein
MCNTPSWRENCSGSTRNERPYPEFLFLGYPGVAEEPCYVVVASNAETVIVTVHNHDPDVYEADHRTRRRQS